MRCLILARQSFFIFWALVALATLLAACADRRPKLSPAAQQETTNNACASSFFLQGRYHELLLQFDKALVAYEQALRCNPDSDYISAKIPILLLQLDQEERAVLWLETFLTKQPDHSGMRMLYANILLSQQKNTQAMAQYQLITDQHPNDPAVLLLLAEMYLGDHQLDQARKVLQKVMQLDTQSYLGHVLLARLASAENNVKKAIVHYRQALAQNWSTELQMEFAELYIAAGRHEEAARLYQDLLRREEFNEEARLALVQVRFLQKKEGAAIAELKRLRNYVDEPQRVDLTIAQLYARQNQFGKAILLVREVLKQEDLAAAHYFLAALLAQEQQYQAALEQLEQIGPETAEFAEAFMLRIRLLQELDRTDEAVALIEANLDTLKVQNVDIYLLIIGLYRVRGQDDDALTMFEKALQLQPENEQLLYEYGLYLESRKRHTAAVKTMNRLITINPAHSEALNFVGYVWADKGINLDQALAYLEKAAKLQPNSGHIRDSLGWVYYRLGRLKEAIQELELALRLSVLDPLVFEHLGDAYVADKQFWRAVKQYDQALARMPEENQQDRERVRQKKAEIEKKLR